ncbi:hypothetical protein R1sor_020759 [Riccia sorocarpa]|uniref:RBR-type E3 ubiquitin transferase n=1 Tax=Riccia sorocarpa TaxID=122646 RepID=A0ABD3GF38_9MARC
MSKGVFMGADWELAYRMQLEEAMSASILAEGVSNLKTYDAEVPVRDRSSSSDMYRSGQPRSISKALNPAKEWQKRQGRRPESASRNPELLRESRDGQYARDHAEKSLQELERREKDMEFALSLVGVSDDELPVEECPICVEKVLVLDFFRVKGCSHRFCISCLTQHVGVRVNSRQVPVKCPQACGSLLEIDQCRGVLSPELVDAYAKCLTEVGVPESDRVYCPFRGCSSFMARASPSAEPSTSGTSFVRVGPTECMECHRLFCAECLVPWHADISCNEYQSLPPGEREAEDIKLRNLASSKKWQQCKKCRRLIELAHGCYHITCRCGHEFCYTCGAPRINKRATCKCLLWDEANLLRTYPNPRHVRRNR